MVKTKTSKEQRTLREAVEILDWKLPWADSVRLLQSESSIVMEHIWQGSKSGFKVQYLGASEMTADEIASDFLQRLSAHMKT
jgi:hypothetical protein